MNPFRAILRKLAAEFRAQRLGRRALREIRFAKYRVPTERDERSVEEIGLRRLPRRLPGWMGNRNLSLTTSH